MALDERDITAAPAADPGGSEQRLSSPAAIVGFGLDDFVPLLALTENLFKEPNHRTVEFAEGLYGCLYRCVPRRINARLDVNMIVWHLKFASASAMANRQV